MMDLKLVKIPEEFYSQYRYDVIFKGYKWDPQVDDHNTVSNYVLLMSEDCAEQLDKWAEELTVETVAMEEALLSDLDLTKQLAFPKVMRKNLKRLQNYNNGKHVRLMRYDFHPTNDGWKISEVNSDVPGGFAESSVMPELVNKYFPDYHPGKHSANSLYEAFQAKLDSNKKIAFVSATSYSDDRQVMQYLSDYFSFKGLEPFNASPDHFKWIDNKAICIEEGYEGEVGGICRFFPLEWLVNLPKRAKWQKYYDTTTLSCNHPISLFAQSKRLPLIWDKLDVNHQTWSKLLPETKEPKMIDNKDEKWIFKPALGRVGEGISIKEAISSKEYNQILKNVKKHPKEWIAQRKFESVPLKTENGEQFHLCVGVFAIDGKSAGFYGRISPYARIDANAKDIPILIVKKGIKND